MEFLKGLHQEQIEDLQNINLKESAEDVKTQTAVLKTRINLLSLLYNLPANVKKVKDDIAKKEEHQQILKTRFADSQESGGIQVARRAE